MKRFNSFIKEEVNPTAFVERGNTNIDDDAVRDNINIHLTSALNCRCVTPYVALQKVSKVLAMFHITLPKVNFLEGSHGFHTFKLQQFGSTVGMKDDGTVVTKVEDPYTLYFEWEQSDNGLFNVFSEIVTDDELSDLLDDVELDINSDTSADGRDEKLDEGLGTLKNIKQSAKAAAEKASKEQKAKSKKLEEEQKTQGQMLADMAKKKRDEAKRKRKLLGLDERAKWRSSSAAEKDDDWDIDSRSTGKLKSKADTEVPYGSLSLREPAKLVTKGKRKGQVTAQHAYGLKKKIKSSLGLKEALQEAANVLDKKKEDPGRAYYEKMYKALHKAATAKGVSNPDVVARLGATQSSLETGYGKHMVGNNAFGIKGKGTKGTVNAATKEVIGGKTVGMKQGFRAYNSPEESAGDYIDFLQKNKRYKGVLGAKDINSAIEAQSKTGYATDPKYGSKLASIHSKYGKFGTPDKPATQVAQKQPAPTTAPQVQKPVQTVQNPIQKPVQPVQKPIQVAQANPDKGRVIYNKPIGPAAPSKVQIASVEPKKVKPTV